jgi:hypothetical protein
MWGSGPHGNAHGMQQRPRSSARAGVHAAGVHTATQQRAPALAPFELGRTSDLAQLQRSRHGTYSVGIEDLQRRWSSAVAVAPPATMALAPLAAATSAAALLVLAAEDDVDPAAVREEAAGVGGEARREISHGTTLALQGIRGDFLASAGPGARATTTRSRRRDGSRP